MNAKIRRLVNDNKAPKTCNKVDTDSDSSSWTSSDEEDEKTKKKSNINQKSNEKEKINASKEQSNERRNGGQVLSVNGTTESHVMGMLEDFLDNIEGQNKPSDKNTTQISPAKQVGKSKAKPLSKKLLESE